MELTTAEANGLARLIAVKQVQNYEMWLEWGDFPELTEGAFERLERCVKSYGEALAGGSKWFDIGEDVDSHYLWERAQ